VKRITALFALCFIPVLLQAQEHSAATKTLVFSHVTVIDATGAPPQPDKTVVIEGDRIVRISSAQGVPPAENAQTVDARGLFLIPGLWDMHVHVWDANLAFPLFLANGVTAVRNTGGHPEDLQHWRKDIAADVRLGPDLIACGPVLDGDPPIHPDHSVVVHNAAEGRAAVDRLQANGWDFIKVYDNLPRDAYFSVAAEAKARHIPFVGHVPLSVTAIEASNSGQKSIEHLDGLAYVISPLGEQFRRARLERIGKPAQPGEMMKLPLRIADEINELADTYDETRASNLFILLARNQTWQVPTLSVAHAFGSVGSQSMYQDSRLQYVSPQIRESWQNNPIVHIEIPEYLAGRKRAFEEALHMTRSAHKAGVPFLAGTDSGGVPYLYYGFSLHDELALLVQAGFTPMEALQAATLKPAQFLGLANQLGTIAQGKQADLVLVEANPLDDIRNTQKIRAVVVRGRYLDRAALDALLSQAKAAASH
jgi:hypothetical protein